MEGTYASNMAVHSVLNVYCLLFIHIFIHIFTYSFTYSFT